MKRGHIFRRRFYAFSAYKSNGYAKRLRSFTTFALLFTTLVFRIIDRKIERLFRELCSFSKHGVASQESTFTSRSPVTLGA